MATTDNAVQYDVRMVREFSPYLNLNACEIENLVKFTEMGIVQRETVAEVAMSATGDFSGDSAVGRDFDDGTDAKTVVSSARNNNKLKGQWTNSFMVRSVTTKTGDLRVIAYNKILDQFHYFYIPYSAYRHISSYIEIIIERSTCYDGEPTFTSIPQRHFKWWEYEVSSFAELCNRQPNKL